MPSTEKKKAHDRARMQRKRAEDAARIEALEDALRTTKEWIDGWSPNFIYDEEWPEQAARIKSLLSKDAVNERPQVTSDDLIEATGLIK